MKKVLQIAALLCVVSIPNVVSAANSKPRARDLGIEVGTISPGKYNAITDVTGVKVGHYTVDIGEDIRTGITAIIPSEHNMYRFPIPAAIYSGNGYGKLVGATQVQELGEIETPIALGCTQCVWTAANAISDWFFATSDTGQHSLNPIVGETNDGKVNNMWSPDSAKKEYTLAALKAAKGGPVEEGSVGAGRGTQAFGWKGGIGTSSRVLPKSLGGYTVGVLVQTNFGGDLNINGAPVGRELGQYSYKTQLEEASRGEVTIDGGSIMMVVATDAPVMSRNLERMAKRAMMGLGRTGSVAHNGSGDYVIAFSTNKKVRHIRGNTAPNVTQTLSNSAMSPLFQGVVEAIQESIYNAMLKAETVTSSRGTLEAIDVEKVKDILDKYKVTHFDETLSPNKPTTY
ncbi:P1 family peptidase [Paraglaciecola sp. 2405UD69-4]|uniref:P1 family peptidase n=1 Tax=Paraglaciecola sp. 2405UD69-4 TaxID=3391836 RepID=UPI0039C98A3D